MNVIFAVIFILSSVVMTVTAPQVFLEALNTGAEKSVGLCFTLMVIYSVWLGIFNILEQSGFTQKFARVLNKPVRFIFGKTSDDAAGYLALNVTANLLGLGSVATPMGIKAAECLDKENNYFAQCMLFAVAATSIQLIPTTAISLRAEFGSVSPADIFLPTLLSTIVSTVCAVVLIKIFVKK